MRYAHNFHRFLPIMGCVMGCLAALNCKQSKETE